MCDLLRELPGWEAIKTTRGHYRSCGKDPQTCCVSHLLGDAPVIRSGREATYEHGKDTGRYWDAGAANVHWVIATDQQVKAGIYEALDRVKSDGVLIEGNSFSEYVPVDRFIMVTGDAPQIIKRSARRALNRTSSIYDASGANQSYNRITKLGAVLETLPVYTSQDIPKIVVDLLRSMNSNSTLSNQLA